jgi:predicted DCC family thiol-disulfide oxidoreductase YuxK
MPAHPRLSEPAELGDGGARALTQLSAAPGGEAQPGAWIVYDGDCPFCSRYVRLVRLREAVGPIRLVNARDGGPLVEEIRRAGLDLDEGMVLKLDGRLYAGAACVRRLALLSTPVGTFNRVNRAILSSATAARVLYPILRSGRNLALRLLGRSQIGHGG